jgi:nicotinamide-nucleotide adenylyltransferase
MQKALIIGRFQPFHKGHKLFIKKALKENESVIIAIGSSQELRTKKNPFDSIERKKMIQLYFKNIEIIDVPDFKTDKEWANYLIKKAKFNIVYSTNKLVNEILSKRKILTKKLKRMPKVSGTKIRKLMFENNKEYKKLIPLKCVNFLKSINAEKIIKESFFLKETVKKGMK